MGLHRAVRGLSALLLLCAPSCSDVIPPDPYLGTIDPSGFDTAFGGPAKSSWPNALYPCLAPRRGFGGGSSGLDGATWFYLGGLTSSQLDISNAADPTRAFPPSVYEVSGCDAGEGRADQISPANYDARLNNYLTDRQYPVVAQGLFPAQVGTATEPTAVGSYRPWHVAIPVKLSDSVRRRMGCNDIKGERSLLERAGWSRETKAFPEGGPADFDISFPSREDIRAGRAPVKFKDWPMVSVAAVLMKTPDATESCPFVTGSRARFPRYPGDTEASFQFPSQHWLRGLLGGYLDGGDLPTTTDPMACGDIARIPTGKSCMTVADCNAAGNEVCTSGRCLAPLPICPKVNDLYVAVDEVPVPTSMTVSNPIPSATVTLKDPADMTKTRTADVLAVFSAVPIDPAYSPVCRLRFFDKKKVTCSRTEPDAIAPRPLCSAAEIKASPGAVLTTPNYYVHCLFLPKQ